MPAAVVESVDSHTIRATSFSWGVPAPVGAAATALVVPEPKAPTARKIGVGPACC